MHIRLSLAFLAVALVACGEAAEPGTFPDDAGATPPVGEGGAASSSSSGGPAIGVTDAGSVRPASPVDVAITADNAYRFGWGDASHLKSMQGRPANANASDIFDCPVGRGPETYVVSAEDAPTDGYLYVVAWDDRRTTQGVLAQFKRRDSTLTTYSGEAAWQVCATGLVYDATSADAQGPTLETVNAELERCSAGAGEPATTSAGWVDAKGVVTEGAVGALTVGEDNSAGYEDGVFPITCQGTADAPGLDAAARWMWYSSDGQPHFKDDPDPRAFLIFRLPTAAVSTPVH